MALLSKDEGLSECISRAIQEHLAKRNIHLEWPQIDHLSHPVLRIEAFLEDGNISNDIPSPHSERIASGTVNLTEIVTPAPPRGLLAIPQATDVGSPNDIDSQGTSEPDEDVGMNNGSDDEPRRKGISGLRISQRSSIQEDLSEHQRQMQVDTRSFPKRRKPAPENFVFQPSTLDKLVNGIWEQIHGSLNLDPKAIFEQFQVASSNHVIQKVPQVNPSAAVLATGGLGASGERTEDSFSQMNLFCRKVTQASRVCRSIEIIVQARWSELFDEQVQLRVAAEPDISSTRHRKTVFMGACQDFGWSEKELRNKMAIWRGYKEVKDAAGWAALVFAGMGIYRFCKYRPGFDKEAMRRLRNLRKRLEVAADTLHPKWRQVLVIVGESPQLEYTGHPHDWVVFEDGQDPVPLRTTYIQMDPYFDFENIDESIIDGSQWGCEDPRWVPQSKAVAQKNHTYTCAQCGEQQSDEPKSNSCYCFPSLFGCVKRRPTPVQIFRTSNGRNNGLVALASFERGAAIGEFVGLITKGVRHLDVMDSSTPLSNYQIWQGRQGNYTRFANHSCKANAQFSTFTWLDTQRVILVSKGLEAGAEIFVDYGDKYWAGLDKACLCGESCCRYRRKT